MYHTAARLRHLGRRERGGEGTRGREERGGREREGREGKEREVGEGDMYSILQTLVPLSPGITLESILATVLSNSLLPRDKVFKNCFSSSLITSITCRPTLF